MPELSGSEFFGHQRGAFTGALAQRDGAFALANGGTLFLDEVGDLPLNLQAQLLRVVQEGAYKRVGGNTWHETKFRLVCATNKNFAEEPRAVSAATFTIASRAGPASCRLFVKGPKTSFAGPAFRAAGLPGAGTAGNGRIRV